MTSRPLELLLLFIFLPPKSSPKAENPHRLTLVLLPYHIPHYLQTHQFLYFQKPKFKLLGPGTFHHLIPDVLTLPRRRTSPTHPYPTVTYGEWYVDMTSTCQLCPSSCPVHIPTTAMSSTSQLGSVVPSSPYFPPQHHMPAGSSRCQCDAYQNNLGNTHQCGAINLKSNQITGRIHTCDEPSSKGLT